MMKPFLWQIAETFYNNYREDIRHIAFVFPNRRAGIFFKKYLSDIADKPLLAPTILTVTDLFAQLSDLQSADKIELLFILYRIYRDVTKRDESFDEFVSLGETIINDFDDTDKYMVDARQLFTNIHDLKEIDVHFGSPLNEEQVAHIRRFWKNFVPTEGRIDSESTGKQKFSSIWCILHELYEKFNNELRTKGIGYEGMIYRDVAEKISNENKIYTPYKKIVFVGLNVLTEAEKKLMNVLKNNGIGDFYWDDSAPTLHDEYNKASYFLKNNTRNFPSSLPLSVDEKEHYDYPQIDVIGVPSAVGQAKESEKILNYLLKNGYISSPEEAINTAIILPDEHMLMPVLYAIPENINPINITMGYSLSNTTIAGLMEILADLHKHSRKSGDNVLYYHRNVLALLTNRYLQLSGQKIIIKACNDIRIHNKIYIQGKDLWLNDLLQHIFIPIETANDACNYLLDILKIVQHELKQISLEGEIDNRAVSTIALEQEYIHHYYLIINRLKELISAHKIELKVATFFNLLKRLSAKISIPFEGEPLSGLQIMGVLETRALDFENVIILSMNEGVFPVKKVSNSIIPYNLRKGFDLSTTEHQDSIYAYYFYRLIYRARRLFLLYDTRTEDMSSGEVSRYVYQLKYHYRVNINHKIAEYQVSTKENESISVSKDNYVLQQLSQYLDGGKRYLSASAINTYLSCPLQFYLCYVEKLQETEDVAESIDAGVFGSIYHNVMQQIYDRFEGHSVQAEALKNIEHDDKLLTLYLERAFAKEYFKLSAKNSKPQVLTGQNYLVGEVIRKYVKRTLSLDREQTPFTYIKSEREIKIPYNFGGEKAVQLKGFIDRMDMSNDIIRIVDYKTGKDRLGCRSIEELFDKNAKERPKAIMQVLMYALMIKEEDRPHQTIAPAIYKIQELFSAQKFNPSILKNLVPLYYTDEIDKEFRVEFDKCIQEIFDPNVPFTQTTKSEENKPCKYCPVSTICRQMAE